MGQGFSEACEGPVLNKNGLILYVKIFTGLLISTFGCFLRIDIFLNLRFDSLEG